MDTNVFGVVSIVYSRFALPLLGALMPVGSMPCMVGLLQLHMRKTVAAMQIIQLVNIWLVMERSKSDLFISKLFQFIISLLTFSSYSYFFARL
jgi:hypothetical protein